MGWQRGHRAASVHVPCHYWRAFPWRMATRRMSAFRVTLRAHSGFLPARVEQSLVERQSAAAVAVHLQRRYPRVTSAAPCPLLPHRQLYEVLSQPALARHRAPVLLACNKQDLGSKAHTVDFIRKRLEKEIDQVGPGGSPSRS